MLLETKRNVQLIFFLYTERETLLISECSEMDPDCDITHPGSNYLWVGDHHRLTSSEVVDLNEHLQRWLDSKSLAPDIDGVRTYRE